MLHLLLDIHFKRTRLPAETRQSTAVTARAAISERVRESANNLISRLPSKSARCDDPDDPARVTVPPIPENAGNVNCYYILTLTLRHLFSCHVEELEVKLL